MTICLCKKRQVFGGKYLEGTGTCTQEPTQKVAYYHLKLI